MKQFILTLGILVFSLSIFAQDQQTPEIKETLKRLPNFELKTLQGETVNIAEYVKSSQKLTIISFWATWCTPCKKEMDILMDFYPEWQEKYNVEYIAVTVDDARGLSKVPGVAKHKGWEYTILSGNPDQVYIAFNFRFVPQMYVVDKKGNIIYSHTSYVPGFEYELDDKIKEWTAQE